VREPTVDLAALESEERCICKAPSGNGEDVYHRVWRIFGVRVLLLRHEVAVERVVVKDTADIIITMG
jgi:hypothetical protein